MATVLDVGLIDYFSIIFPFLMGTFIVYAILQYSEFFGKDNKNINLIIALCAGILLMISEKALLVIKFITPWFVLLFVFLMLMLMIFKLLGASDEDIRKQVRGEGSSDKTIVYWIITVSVLILIIGLGSVYGQTLMPFTGGTDATTSDFEANAWSAFFHPKVVGLIFISLVAAFSIKLLAGESVRQ